MKTAFNKILLLGIKETQSSHDKRRIKTTNLINLIMIFFLIVGLANYLFLKTDFSLFGPVLFMLSSVFSLLLNKYNKTNLSFLLFSLNANLSILLINKYYPVESGTYMFYFPLIVSIVLLNNPSLKDRYSLIHFTICILFFVFNLLFEFPEFRIQDLSAHQVKLLWYSNLIVSTFITGVLSYLFARIIYKQNKEIILQNEDLHQAQENLNLSLKEKEVLLAELNHRVKNNLAIIIGLLNLQESTVSNEDAKRVLNDSRTRILSMALVHKMLYANPELKNIDIANYTSALLSELLNSYNLTKNANLKEDYDEIALSVNKSIPLGLILNELITNSIKYAYKYGQSHPWMFNISIKSHGNKIKVVAKDNGPGFKEDFNEGNEGVSLGIFLIKTLAEQIDGEVRFSNENGAKIELDFTLN